MTSVMDCIKPIVSLIGKNLIAPINYWWSFEGNIKELRTVVKDLQARRNDEQIKLKAKENAGGVKTYTASNWFAAVGEIEVEAANIEKKSREEGAQKTNCWSRYELSKMSVELKQKAKARHGEQFDLTRQPSLKTVVKVPIEPVENQPSTQVMLKKILDCINDPENGIIGVCGMGGVGKTTLAKLVNNHFDGDPCFDIVIMVTVSATPNMKTIQTRIGKSLGLDLSNDSEGDARDKLFVALGSKKFLLILDDVWFESNFDIMDVGIPHPGNHKGGKILVTSRNKDVCTDMGATAKSLIQVKPLLEPESWNLFVKSVGRDVAVVADIERSAREIVKRCEGLPLAIITVARAMANRHEVGEWANAVREMKNLRGMKEKVFVPLKFSYDRLEDDMLRTLFLYCACCFPEDYNIRKQLILDYCVGKGLVDKLGSLAATRNKCDALIGSLKIACMLEDGEYDEESVRMHDILRDLGIWIITSSSISPSKDLTRSGISIKEAPQAHEWPEAICISLMGTQIEKLPELGEVCPKLTTLLLSGNWNLTVIPPTNFFQHMDHLTVLDFSETDSLKSLPDSLSCLVSLRVLRLMACINLKVLPALGMLRQLQVLDLQDCERLHRQILNSECMGGIRNLRYLNLVRSKVYFQQGGISHLRLLEELKINRMKWRVSDEDNKEEGSGLTSSSTKKKKKKG